LNVNKHVNSTIDDSLNNNTRIQKIIINIIMVKRKFNEEFEDDINKKLRNLVNFEVFFR